MLSHGTLRLQPPARHQSVRFDALPHLQALKSDSTKSALPRRAEHGPTEQELFPLQDSSGPARKVQALLNSALAWRHFSLPAGNSPVLTERLCRAYKNSTRPEWEKHAERGNSKLPAACYCLCHQPRGGRTHCCFTRPGGSI